MFVLCGLSGYPVIGYVILLQNDPLQNTYDLPWDSYK